MDSQKRNQRSRVCNTVGRKDLWNIFKVDNICDLQNQKHQLEQFAFRFKNGNEKYLQIKSMAEQVVDRLLAERKSLLSSALVAVVEALRMNPDRYAVIYNSKCDNNDCNVFESSNNTADISSSMLLLIPIVLKSLKTTITMNTMKVF
jgi:hypothetical protein